MNLDIVNIVPKQETKHPLVNHSVLPQHEFSMLIVAPKGSGKTNFICNLLLNHYKGYFHKVLVCSPTVENDEKWEVVKETKKVLVENKRLQEILHNKPKKAKHRVVWPSQGKLEENLEKKERFTGQIPEMDFFMDLNEVPRRVAEQQAIIHELKDRGYGKQAKYIADRMLIILDDQAGMFKGGNVNNPMVNFVIKHRHSSSSVIVVTQAYKAIPKTIRTNCNALILFEIPNNSELKVIYEENPEGYSEEEWLQLYEHATNRPFEFLYINNKFRKGERLYRCFTKKLSLAHDHASSFMNDPMSEHSE